MKSFKNKSAEEIKCYINRFSGYVPVYPNPHTPWGPSTHLYLEPPGKTTRDTWVRTDESFTVPSTFLRLYKERPGMSQPRLTVASVNQIRRVIGRPLLPQDGKRNENGSGPSNLEGKPSCSTSHSSTDTLAVVAPVNVLLRLHHRDHLKEPRKWQMDRAAAWWQD